MGERVLPPLQSVQRAAHPTAALVQDVRVNHGRLHALVAEQFLDGADVVSILEQMGCEGMAQGVTGGA